MSQPPHDPWGPYGQQGQPSYQPPQPPGYPPYGGQPPGAAPPGRPGRPRKRHRGLKITLGVLGGLFAIIIIAAAASRGGSGGGTSGGTSAAASTSAPAPSQAAAAAPAAKPARQTVTYVVRGSSADVTYGPDGSDLAGSVPMRVTRHLGHPQYYAISAQLNGSGTVSCKILVDGRVISRATASGAYEIADCEIVQGLLSGKWEDANSG